MHLDTSNRQELALHVESIVIYKGREHRVTDISHKHAIGEERIRIADCDGRHRAVWVKRSSVAARTPAVAGDSTHLKRCDALSAFESALNAGVPIADLLALQSIRHGIAD